MKDGHGPVVSHQAEMVGKIGRPLYLNACYQANIACVEHLLEPDLLIWVDAICINQEDIPERNVQVTMMDRVYERAKAVFVWLGEADSDCESIMGKLCDVTERYSKSPMSKVLKRTGEITALHRLSQRLSSIVRTALFSGFTRKVEREICEGRKL